MSFIRPEDHYYERKILGSGCSCVYHLNPIHPRYYGHGISDVLDKVLSPTTANSISKIVAHIPNIYDTIKNVIGSNPNELNKKIAEVVENNPSTAEDIIKAINSHPHKGKGKSGKLLSNHSQLILQSLLGNQKRGSGIQTY